MKIIFAFAAVCGALLAGSQAAAQSITYPPAIAAPAAGNQTVSNQYELFAGTDGGGTTFASPSSGINTKSACAAIGTPSAEWEGFWLWIGQAGSSNRYLIDIAVEDGPDLLSNYFVAPGGSTGYRPVYFRVRAAAGAPLCVRVQASATSASIRLYIEGVKRNAKSPPSYSAAIALNADTTNTRPSAVNIPVNAAGWTTLVDPTAAAYDGYYLSANPAATPVGSLSATLSLATGVVGEEVRVAEFPVQVLTSAPTAPQAVSHFYEQRVPAGVRLSAKATAASSSNADNWRLQVLGLTP